MRIIVAVLCVHIASAGELDGQAGRPIASPERPFDARAQRPLLPVLSDTLSLWYSQTELAPISFLDTGDQVWDDPPRLGNLISYGVVGGVAGGAALAAVTDCLTEPLSPRCWPIAFGEAVGIATGVHFGNQRRGLYGLDLLASGTVAAVGLGVLLEDSGTRVRSQPTAIFMLPIGQLVASILAERLSDR